MYKLYYTTRSFTTESTALIPRIALEELGVPYDVVEVELSPAPPDWYLALNRHGQVPTLTMGSAEKPVHVAPSPAILLALMEAHPGGGLWPDTAEGRAVCYARLLDMVEMLHSGFMRLFTPERCTADHDGADAIVAASLQSISRFIESYDDLLALQPNVAGDSFTICDIYFYVMARWYVDLGEHHGFPKLSSFVHVVTFCRSIEARQAVTRSLQSDELLPIG